MANRLLTIHICMFGYRSAFWNQITLHLLLQTVLILAILPQHTWQLSHHLMEQVFHHEDKMRLTSPIHP